MQITSDNITNNCIKFIQFRDITLWDVKRYALDKLQSNYPIEKLGYLIKEESHRVKLHDFPNEEFGILGVSNKTGIFDAYIEKGENINQSYKRMEKNWLAYNPYRVNVGSIGILTDDQKYNFISPVYVVFSCKEALLPDFLFTIFKTERFRKIINEHTTGSVRQSLTFDILKTLDIPLPSFEIQKEIWNKYYSRYKEALEYEKEVEKLKIKIENYLFDRLSILIRDVPKVSVGIKFIKYKDIIEWGINKIIAGDIDKSNLYPTVSIQTKKDLLIKIYRGKTPHYDDVSDIFILNQKCIKWDEIESQYAKGVSEKWINQIDKNIFTQIGDVLINSTGEGTIGRSCVVTKKMQGLLYDSHVLCLRLNKDIINPHYWVSLFNSKYVQQQIEKLKSAQSTNQTELGILNVLKIQIPFPDIGIQNLIVKEVAEMKKAANSLKEKAEVKYNDAIKTFEQIIFKN
jgi:restriction endonuclease S subunit